MPYSYVWADQWFIELKQGWTNKNRGNMSPEEYFKKTYPSIHRYFEEVAIEDKGKGKGLKARDDQGDYWWELRPCSYYDEFAKDKIVWGELSDKAKFCFDDQKMFANNTVFFMTGDYLKFILSILNSSLAFWYFEKISTSSGMGTNRWLKYKIEQLPIPPVQREQEVEQLVNHIIARKKEKLDTALWENKLDALVFHFYGLSREDMDLILDTFDDLSIKDRNQIQNEYWNVGNGKFRLEL